MDALQEVVTIGKNGSILKHFSKHIREEIEFGPIQAIREQFALRA